MTIYTVLDGDDRLLYSGESYAMADKAKCDCIEKLVDNGYKYSDAEQLVTFARNGRK